MALPDRVTPLVVALVACAVVAACGDDGPPDPASYFEGVRRAQDAYSERSANLDERFPGRYAEVAPTHDSFLYSADSTRDFIADLEALDPPTDAQGRHSDVLSALEDIASVQERVASDIDAIETVAEMDEILDGPRVGEFDAAFARMRSACNRLQEIADESGFGIELDCPTV